MTFGRALGARLRGLRPRSRPGPRSSRSGARRPRSGRLRRECTAICSDSVGSPAAIRPDARESPRSRLGPPGDRRRRGCESCDTAPGCVALRSRAGPAARPARHRTPGRRDAARSTRAGALRPVARTGPPRSARPRPAPSTPAWIECTRPSSRTTGRSATRPRARPARSARGAPTESSSAPRGNARGPGPGGRRERPHFERAAPCGSPGRPGAGRCSLRAHRRRTRGSAGDCSPAARPRRGRPPNCIGANDPELTRPPSSSGARWAAEVGKRLRP